MRSVAVVSAVAGGLWWLAPVTPALAAPDPGPGRICEFTSVADYSRGRPHWIGVVEGGPLPLGDDTDPTVTYSGSITCTIQVGANSTHAGTDAFTVTGPTTPAVAVLPETPASYEATGNENVYLCAQVNIEGGDTLYWAVANPAVPLVGTWSTDWNSGCGQATCVRDGCHALAIDLVRGAARRPGF